jgi:hypothetical protein
MSKRGGRRGGGWRGDRVEDTEGWRVARGPSRGHRELARRYADANNVCIQRKRRGEGRTQECPGWHDEGSMKYDERSYRRSLRSTEERLRSTADTYRGTRGVSQVQRRE